jgi:hypothetical protein
MFERYPEETKWKNLKFYFTGEDMQGYVTELLLTLEAAVDSLDSDFRPLDVMKDIFKSTPNLNNKDGVVTNLSKFYLI